MRRRSRASFLWSHKAATGNFNKFVRKQTRRVFFNIADTWQNKIDDHNQRDGAYQQRRRSEAAATTKADRQPRAHSQTTAFAHNHRSNDNARIHRTPRRHFFFHSHAIPIGVIEQPSTQCIIPVGHSQPHRFPILFLGIALGASSSSPWAVRFSL
jgi:hypothetical protein